MVKEPRQRDEVHLNYIRSLPCCICGNNVAVEAAHIRSGSILHAKRWTGLAEKPSDKWTVPLCNFHHRMQHEMNEGEFWASHRLNPFLLAIQYRKPNS